MKHNLSQEMSRVHYMQPWIPIPSHRLGARAGNFPWGCSLRPFTRNMVKATPLRSTAWESRELGREMLKMLTPNRIIQKQSMAAPLLMSLAGCKAHPKVPCRVLASDSVTTRQPTRSVPFVHMTDQAKKNNSSGMQNVLAYLRLGAEPC